MTTKFKMIVTSGVGGKGVALETSRVMAVPFLWCGVIDLQVPSQGSGVAKPQLCAFRRKDKGGGAGSRELSSRRLHAPHI